GKGYGIDRSIEIKDSVRIECPLRGTKWTFFIQLEIPLNFRLNKNAPLWMRTRAKWKKVAYATRARCKNVPRHIFI
ncbi:MAG: hypothetical protein PUE21_06015, partial [Lachnospiraceae bacterium]|nr:hypothetical protein [Lachnospiraceae bacterium]